MQHKIKFSVIVPVYNVENYLRECLDSILAYQGDLEVIAVDDGSTDSSGKILDEYRDDRLKVFHKENEGVFKTWIYGVERSTGDYLVFVDSDDYMDCALIDEAEKILSEKEYDLLQFGWENIFCNPKRENFLSYYPDEELEGEKLKAYLKEHFFEPKDAFGMYLQYRWAKVFRAELFKKILPDFKTQTFYLYEDFTSVLYYLTKIKSLRNISKVCYHYRQDRPCSATNSYGNAELYYNDCLQSLKFLNEFAGGGDSLYTEKSYAIFYKRNLKIILEIAGNSYNRAVTEKILKDPFFRECVKGDRGLKNFLWKHGMVRTYLLMKRIKHLLTGKKFAS